MVMKKLVKTAIFFLIFAVLAGCKSREKQVQKSETQTETKSEAAAKIETKTFEIVQDKELSIFDKSNFAQNSETQKEQTKDIQVIREYYENGNFLKSEIQKSFSQLSEATKYAIAEMREKLTKETEDKKYFENSSNHYYSLWQQEIAKSKTKDLQVKSKPTYTWQMFFVGLFLGWLILPSVFRFLWSVLKRFQPYLKFVEWIKNLKFKK